MNSGFFSNNKTNSMQFSHLSTYLFSNKNSINYKNSNIVVNITSCILFQNGFFFFKFMFLNVNTLLSYMKCDIFLLRFNSKKYILICIM